MIFSKDNKIFVSNLIRQSRIRTDGRNPEDYRKIQINFHNHNFGQVEVSIGKSKVICTVDGKITEPKADRPNEGFFYINVDIESFYFTSNYTDDPSNLLDSDTSCYRPTFREESNEISIIIQRLLKNSKAIDYESLCIIPGSQVWCIRVDIRPIDLDGNLRDVCTLAAVCGIIQYSKQDTLTEKLRKEFTILDHQRIPVSTHLIPILVSFGYIQNFEDSFIVDPMDVEERILDGKISVGVNQFGEICGIYGAGGASLNFETIMLAVGLATKKAKHILDNLATVIENDMKKRKAEQLNLNKKYMVIPMDIRSYNIVENAVFFLKRGDIGIQNNNEQYIHREMLNSSLAASKLRINFFEKNHRKNNVSDEKLVVSQMKPPSLAHDPPNLQRKATEMETESTLPGYFIDIGIQRKQLNHNVQSVPLNQQIDSANYIQQKQLDYSTRLPFMKNKNRKQNKIHSLSKHGHCPNYKQNIDDAHTDFASILIAKKRKNKDFNK